MSHNASLPVYDCTSLSLYTYLVIFLSEYFYIHDDLGLFWLSGTIERESLYTVRLNIDPHAHVLTCSI